MKRKMWAKAELWMFESYLEETHFSQIAAIADSQAVLDVGKGEFNRNICKRK